MRAYPHFPNRVCVDLNDWWDFVFLENSPPDINQVAFTDRLPVPSAFDAFPDYAGRRGLGIYRKTVPIHPGNRAVLKFGGAGMHVRVFVDGTETASHIGTYTPFEVVVPPSSLTEREIRVIADNRYDYDRCPLHENFFDFYNYGGMIRPVWLEELPDEPFERVRIRVEDFRAGRINVQVDFFDKPVPIRFRLDDGPIQDADGVTAGANSIEFNAWVPDPVPWSPENPSLRRLRIESRDDVLVTRFGLREVRTEKGKILLNDKPLKLLGYCRHEAHPQFGPSVPATLMKSDLHLLRDMGCNFIRGAHYQQDPLFLDLCDEMGFLFFSESLSWGAGEKQLTDPRFIRAQVDQTEAMVRSDFNHPSIILWGFLNEGASDREFAGECYSGLIRLIRKLDPTRLVTYASNRGAGDRFLEQVDVVSFNMYPGWYSTGPDGTDPLDAIDPAINETLEMLSQRGLDEKPLILSEIGAGAIFGWRDAMNGHWSEDYQAELLQRVCKRVCSDDRISGVALWQFCDCRTYQGTGACGRPRAFNNKGTFDEYRRPKKARDVVREVFRGALDA